MSDEKAPEETAPDVNIDELLKLLQAGSGKRIKLSKSVLKKLSEPAARRGPQIDCPEQDICILCDADDVCKTCDAMDWCVGTHDWH